MSKGRQVSQLLWHLAVRLKSEAETKHFGKTEKGATDYPTEYERASPKQRLTWILKDE